MGKRAEFVRRIPTEFGDVRLYRLSVPLYGFRYVLVSSIEHGPEACIFGSDREGSVDFNSSELPGSVKGTRSHEMALSAAGYGLGSVAEYPEDRFEQQFRDMRDRLDAAKRHVRAWGLRPVEPSAEESAESHQHLAHAHGALERLASAVESLRGELASALVQHQTDQADGLLSFWDAEVGDRSYGIDLGGSTS